MMGQLFRELCKGPVVVIDDMIGTNKDPIDKLIAELESNRLPVLKYKTITDIQNSLPRLCFCNFVILDWKMIGGADLPPGVERGEEAVVAVEQEVIQLIQEIQKISLAPIFLFSNLNIDEISSKLEDAGINVKGKKSVFVEKKTLCETKGALVSKIEQWIMESPHIYLTKWWFNEWLSKSTILFWELYNLNPDWPASFYRSFKEDMDEPILALRDALFQLILSEIDVSSINESLFDKQLDDTDVDRLSSLKGLYRRLVYTTNNIDRDIRPGDIFKIRENDKTKYFLNIRPECDTTKRTSNPELYLLEGKPGIPNDVSYDNEYGIIEKVNQIVMYLLDDEDFVIFDKRKLSIKKYNNIKDHKICRVVAPFITRYRQSFVSYLGRFGVPNYPKEIIASFFKKQNG